mgnify:CR=1 FL=1
MILTKEPNNAPTTKKEKGNILFIGFLGKEICRKIVDCNYTGFSLSNFNKAFYWLENQILKNGELPAAIICDFNLPDGTAYSFFNKIRNNQYLNHIPFIVLAKNVTQQEKTKAMQLGIDDFYISEFNSYSICDRIEFLRKFKPQMMQKPQVRELNLNFFFPLFKIPYAKRLVDITLSLSALIILSPLFLLLAILIKLESKGAVFYVSKRAGTGYRIFDFYKFRTMILDADKGINELMHLNQYGNSPEGKKTSFLKIENDPRITRMGRFLRNTSLDELPQLINVLKGDMSLVGNRPLPLYEAEMLTRDQWAKRFLAPSGITGLWQVTKRGKSEMSEEERMEMDIAYADKASFWFDLKILLLTFPALLQKRAV